MRRRHRHWASALHAIVRQSHLHWAFQVSCHRLERWQVSLQLEICLQRFYLPNTCCARAGWYVLCTCGLAPQTPISNLKLKLDGLMVVCSDSPAHLNILRTTSKTTWNLIIRSWCAITDFVFGFLTANGVMKGKAVVNTIWARFVGLEFVDPTISEVLLLIYLFRRYIISKSY